MSARLVFEFVGGTTVFVLQTHEMPETMDWGSKANLKKINFPGGKQAVQTIGIYREPIEFTATFYGESAGKTAMQRAIALKTHIGKIANVKWYDTDDNVEHLGKYAIESVIPTIRNRFDIECKIALHPHDGYTQLKGVRGLTFNQQNFGLGGLGGDKLLNVDGLAGEVANVQGAMANVQNNLGAQTQSFISQLSTISDNLMSGGNLPAHRGDLDLSKGGFGVVKPGTLPPDTAPPPVPPQEVVPTDPHSRRQFTR